jgi:hypothetical protein
LAFQSLVSVWVTVSSFRRACGTPELESRPSRRSEPQRRTRPYQPSCLVYRFTAAPCGEHRLRREKTSGKGPCVHGHTGAEPPRCLRRGTRRVEVERCFGCLPGRPAGRGKLCSRPSVNCRRDIRVGKFYFPIGGRPTGVKKYERDRPMA